MASSCMSRLAKFCRRCRARSDLYPGAGKVWTVCGLACFLSSFDKVVSVNIATSSSSLCRSVDGASLQFFDRVVDIASMLQRQVRTVPNCAHWTGC